MAVRYRKKPLADTHNEPEAKKVELSLFVFGRIRNNM